MCNTLKANAVRIEQVVEEQTKGKMLELNSDREPARHSALSGKGRMSALQRARLLAKERARASETRSSVALVSSGL